MSGANSPLGVDCGQSVRARVLSWCLRTGCLLVAPDGPARFGDDSRLAKLPRTAREGYRASRCFNREDWVRGKTATPHPTEHVEHSATPSPSRGEGTATATALKQQDSHE